MTCPPGSHVATSFLVPAPEAGRVEGFRASASLDADGGAGDMAQVAARDPGMARAGRSTCHLGLGQLAPDRDRPTPRVKRR